MALIHNLADPVRSHCLFSEEMFALLQFLHVLAGLLELAPALVGAFGIMVWGCCGTCRIGWCLLVWSGGGGNSRRTAAWLHQHVADIRPLHAEAT